MKKELRKEKWLKKWGRRYERDKKLF